MSIVLCIVINMITTIQVPAKLRDDIKEAAQTRAKHMGISKLSMVDYLQLLIREELSTDI